MSRHVGPSSGSPADNPAPEPIRPSYRDAIAYYLRDDISEVLWQLSRRRALRFFYHPDEDMRLPHAKARHVTLHCLDSCDEFRARISAVTDLSASHPFPFYPFFGMTNAPANLPGERETPIGWDMRFEVDLDLHSSFQALIPVAAVLEWFGVPVLSKFSGHRSMHVVVPAEAFPEPMRRRPAHDEWLAAFDKLGRLLCRLAPALAKGTAGLAKSFILTAPYSLHRYNGLLSLPLTVDQAVEFDPDTASVEGFSRVSWRPDHLDGDGSAMARLIDFAERSESRPEIAMDLAGEVFDGERWENFAVSPSLGDIRNDPVLAALVAGPPCVGWMERSSALPPPVRGRIYRALAAIDSPDTKNSRLFRMVVPGGFTHPVTSLTIRRAICKAIACWVRGGLPEALSHLLQVASSLKFEAPVSLAVRLSSLLPESQQALFAALSDEWRRAAKKPEPQSLFLALALLELSELRREALDLIAVASDAAHADSLRTLLLRAGHWQVERRPDLAAAALCLAFGAETLHACADDPEGRDARIVLRGVFGGSIKKFRHAMNKVLPPNRD